MMKTEDPIRRKKSHTNPKFDVDKADSAGLRNATYKCSREFAGASQNVPPVTPPIIQSVRTPRRGQKEISYETL